MKKSALAALILPLLVPTMAALAQTKTDDMRLGLPAMTMQFLLPPPSRPVFRPRLSMAFNFTGSADGLTIGEAQPIQAAGTTLTESAPAKRSEPAAITPACEASTPGWIHAGT